MGLTQHAHGVDTIKALVNVGLARGLPGRPNRGLVPIRGHSGVQGGAEVGCVPTVDRGDAPHAGPTSGDFRCPTARRAGPRPRWSTTPRRGEVDVVLDGRRQLSRDAAGRRSSSRAALARPRLRIHQDIVLSSSMLVESDGDVLLLPATTRYESPGGGTETSTERRIIFSPEIPGRRIGSAQAGVVGVRRGDGARVPRARATHPVRRARRRSARRSRAPIPLYAGIETLAAKGDQVQWGGRTLYADGRFATPDGKARFAVASPSAQARALAGRVASSSRRAAASSSTRWCSARSIR